MPTLFADAHQGAEGDRDDVVLGVVVVVTTLEPGDTKSVLTIPDTTEGSNTGFPNSSSEMASGPRSVSPPQFLNGRQGHSSLKAVDISELGR